MQELLVYSKVFLDVISSLNLRDMKWWKQTYLSALWNYDRRLGVMAVVFVASTLFFNLLGDQMAPFFVWGMFSQQNTEQPSYQVLQIMVDEELLDYTCLPDPQKHLLSNPILKYAAQLENSGVDPTATFLQSKLGSSFQHLDPLSTVVLNDSTEMEAFPAWVHRYVDYICGRPSKELNVSVVYYSYGQGDMILQNYEHVLNHVN